LRNRSRIVMTALFLAGCGLPPATTTKVEDESAAVTVAAPAGPLSPVLETPPPDDCYKTVSISAFLWSQGVSSNFDWPGPSPWNGQHGWVSVARDASGRKAVYGITHGATFDSDQVIWFDLDPTDAEIDALRCLPENLHCRFHPTSCPDSGKLGAGVPPEDGGNADPPPLKFCVSKSVFTSVDTVCQGGGGGVASSCAPAPVVDKPCVPHTCGGRHGIVPDGCGGELCCQSKGNCI